MNIKQALKRKNKLVGEIAQEFKKVSQYNSIEEKNERPYSARESIKNWLGLTEELITLKCKIQAANSSVNDKIYRLSELKTQCKMLKELGCESGTHYSKWPDEKYITKVAEIGILERDKMVKKIESQIETIQDELDEWNHKTILS